jgi:hypothetical protein
VAGGERRRELTRTHAHQLPAAIAVKRDATAPDPGVNSMPVLSLHPHVAFPRHG